LLKNIRNIFNFEICYLKCTSEFGFRKGFLIFDIWVRFLCGARRGRLHHFVSSSSTISSLIIKNLNRRSPIDPNKSPTPLLHAPAGEIPFESLPCGPRPAQPPATNPVRALSLPSPLVRSARCKIDAGAAFGY
jgi:hypothetical protein